MGKQYILRIMRVFAALGIQYAMCMRHMAIYDVSYGVSRGGATNRKVAGSIPDGVMSLEFFIGIILPAALWSLGR
jgi:hypothetical protein